MRRRLNFLMMRFRTPNDLPRLAAPEEADLAVKSAQTDVLVPVQMANAMRTLQRVIARHQPGTEPANGSVTVSPAPRDTRGLKSFTVKY